MQVRFWGVRGSVAASGAEVARVGGNTSCVEVTHQGQRLILDAGTGIRALGDELLRAGGPVEAALLFSHLHWDHVQGFPFFAPAYRPDTRLLLYGPGPGGDVALREALSRQMSPPGFPVTLEAMRAQLRFLPALPGESIQLGGFVVRPFALPHPQGCMGYRIEAEGRSFVFMTDVELSLEAMTPEIRAAIVGADALCLDAQYTPAEYQGIAGVPKKGWGHSTMIDAAQVAAAAGVGRLFLFHHDPAHNDDLVEEMAQKARAHFPSAEPAREGVRFTVGEVRTG